ncbi:MAG: thiamine-phosphate kinase [Marinilabiliales bacterium]|nr:MAG: thiamine-phosphate kinase [Marinilabiliales bacterium]
MKKKKNKIKELGEFGLIRHLTSDITMKNPSTLKGPGDDAAVLDYGGKLVVVTSDILMEGIHFNLIYTPMKHLGYKSVVANLSDIYAMNARPRQIIVSLAFSSKLTLEQVENLYAGIKLACETYNVDLAGGDTSTSVTGMAISITAIGEGEKNRIVYRNGAKKNDLICVSGDLGAAYLGLQLLEREKKIYLNNPEVQPELEGYEYLLQRQLKPEPRADIIEYFREHNAKPSAMIDISDGLSSEVMHICKESGTGCKLFAEHIPVHSETEKLAAEFNITPLVAALNGGEDYELLFTVSPGEFVKLKENRDIRTIGHITDRESDCNLITHDGSFIPLQAQGWNAWHDKD